MFELFGLVEDLILHQRSCFGTDDVVDASFVVVESAVEAFAILIIVLGQGKQQALALRVEKELFVILLFPDVVTARDEVEGIVVEMGVTVIAHQEGTLYCFIEEVQGLGRFSLPIDRIVEL